MVNRIASSSPSPSPTVSRLPHLYQWIDQVTTALPALSRPQATVLALRSSGMVLAQRCALSAVAAHLAALLGEAFATVNRRLRAWYGEMLCFYFSGWASLEELVAHIENLPEHPKTKPRPS